MSTISDKKTFLSLWKAGKLGNRLRMWETVEELNASGFSGLVRFRSRIPDKRYSSPAVPAHLAAQAVAAAHLPLVDCYFGEVAEDERLRIQGEFGDPQGQFGGYVGNVLSYSTLQLPMRRAFDQDQRHAYGSAAIAIIRSYMDGNSWDDFNFLRDQYPNAVIEFGVYEHFVGCLPARNTIFWEVRDY